MLHIKYKLAQSGIHGIGLFSGQDVKQGELIYTASPTLDLNITKEQFESLKESEKAEVRWWGFFDKPTGLWHVDFDVSKFLNHSFEPSATQDSNHDDAYLIAVRNIKAGEELTQNYLEFETKEDLAQREIA